MRSVAVKWMACATFILICSEGQVLDMKYKGMYCFTHTDELRSAYDTYKVIHTLAREGFKDQPVQPITNVYVAGEGKRK